MDKGDDLDNINAPQFVDFLQPMETDENIEDYFNFDHENGGEMVMNNSKSESNGENSFYMDAKDNTPITPKREIRRSARNTPKNQSSDKLVVEGDIENNLADGNDKKKKGKSNICTDMAAWRKGTTKIIENGNNKKMRVEASPSMKKSRRSAAATPEMSKEKQRDTTTEKKSNHIRTRSFETRSSSLRRSNSLRSVSVEIKSSCTSKPITRRSTEKAVLSDVCEKNLKPKITLPSTPTFLKREMKFLHTGQVKSTEDMEVERIREFQKTLAQKRKAQEQFRQKALAATTCKPALSAIPLTKPEEFHFKTDTRVKNTAKEINTSTKEQTFMSKLRSNSSSCDSGGQKLLPKKTIPQPFSFDRKRKHDPEQLSKSQDGEPKYYTMAEKINKFTGTPERFRSKPSNKEPSPAKRRRRSMSQPHLTFPKTPNLQTRGRSRPTNVKSQAQIEEEEVAEIHKYEFHARPVNEKIFQNSCLGVKKIVPKESTVPESFDLETERRADSWKNRSDDKDESYHFHAKPVSKAILDGPVGIKPMKSIPVTMPESPAFALKNRLRSSIKVPEVLPQEEKKATKAKPAHGLPFQPRFERKVTEIEPFSFEERNRRIQLMKEEKIRKLQEEESKVPDFHANPIPDLSPVLPPKKTKPTTKPEPFNLELDARGAYKAEEWSAKIKEELKHQRELAKFKAQPNKVVSSEPFVPRKSTKPLTVIDDFELNSDSRAQQREQWEHYRHEKDLEQDEMRRARENQQLYQDQKEVERLRKEMVPKAQPVRKYKDVVVKTSDKELTQPQTPRFSERLKSRVVRL